MDYGARIRAAREARGWTQFDLGVAIDHRDSDISRWERGIVAPKISALVNIAAALGVPLDYLAGVTSEMTLAQDWADVRRQAPAEHLERLPEAPPEGATDSTPRPSRRKQGR